MIASRQFKTVEYRISFAWVGTSRYLCKLRNGRFHLTSAAGDGRIRRRAVRQSEIIAAAVQVFFEKGFSRASMDDVSSAVGGSKRTLYQHFPSKEDLFAAVVTSASERTISPLQAEVMGDLPQTHLDVGTRDLSMLVSPDGLAVYRAMASEAPYLPDLADTFFEKGPQRLSDALTDIFDAYSKSGRAKIDHPRGADEQFIGMLRGNVHLAALTRHEIASRNQIACLVESAMRTLLNGVMTAPRKAERPPRAAPSPGRSSG